MKQEHSNRENILECAQQLFYEKGYESVGVQEIVDTAGITKPTMYYYFKSKQGLLECLLQEGGTRILDAMRDVVQMEGEFMEVLQCVIRRYLLVAMEDREFYLMLMSLYFSARGTEGHKTAKPYIVQLLRILQEFFEQVSKTYTKIQGKEVFLSVSLTGIVNTYMLVAFEKKAADEIIEDPQIVTDIANQFAMYE